MGEQDHTGADKKTAVELERGHFPGGHWLGLGVSFAEGIGWTPGGGTKILLAMCHDQKKDL